MKKQVSTAVPEIEPAEFEELWRKKAFLIDKAIRKVHQLSIQDLESLLETIEAHEEGCIENSL